ncbi:hypothetical protein FS749_016022 [Ceratobasidium sp. UAMH 11750]|nr:hypothetical protein FS749_016022 [Ceratobasidium sp. UAMH 11750]
MAQLTTGVRRLPEELIIRILQFRNFRDILRFSATCSKFLELVRSTASLQLQIELEANRLRLADNYVQSNTHELLEALKCYQNNRLDLRLDPGQAITLIPNGRRHALIRLHNGLFGNVYSSSNTISRFRANAIELIPLDDPASRWNLTFDVIFHQLAIDSSQDLIVLAILDETDNYSTLILRFNSLKTGLAHPLAQQPLVVLKLEFSVTPTRSYTTIGILVAEEVLVINLNSSDLTPNRRCDVLTIDWRTGLLRHHLGKRQGICSTAYLDKDRLAVFFADIRNSHRGISMASSISLLLFEPIGTTWAENPRPEHNTWDISTCPTLSPAFELRFPAFKTGAGILVSRFRACSAPLPGNVTACSSKFVPDPWCQMLGLTMVVYDGSAERDFIIFIDVQKVLHRLPQASPQKPAGSHPWQTWGENATRWIEVYDLPIHLICGFHGSRFVTGHSTSDDYRTQLVVADFNPVLIKKARAHDNLAFPKNKSSTRGGTWPRLSPIPEKWRMLVDNVDEETPTVIEGFSETPIVSRLPYRVTVVGGPSVEDSDWMIEGNRLIELKKASPVGNSSHEQLVVHYMGD